MFFSLGRKEKKGKTSRTLVHEQGPAQKNAGAAGCLGIPGSASHRRRRPPPTSSTQCFPPSRPKELALVVRVAETPVLGRWWHSSPSIVSYREKENVSKIKFLKLLLLGLQMRLRKPPRAPRNRMMMIITRISWDNLGTPQGTLGARVWCLFREWGTHAPRGTPAAGWARSPLEREGLGRGAGPGRLPTAQAGAGRGRGRRRRLEKEARAGEVRRGPGGDVRLGAGPACGSAAQRSAARRRGRARRAGAAEGRGRRRWQERGPRRRAGCRPAGIGGAGVAGPDRRLSRCPQVPGRAAVPPPPPAPCPGARWRSPRRSGGPAPRAPQTWWATCISRAWRTA